MTDTVVPLYCCCAEELLKSKQSSAVSSSGGSSKLINPIDWLDSVDWSKPVKPRDAVVTKIIKGGAEAFDVFEKAIREMTNSDTEETARFQSCATVR